MRTALVITGTAVEWAVFVVLAGGTVKNDLHERIFQEDFSIGFITFGVAVNIDHSAGRAFETAHLSFLPMMLIKMAMPSYDTLVAITAPVRR